MPATRSPFPGMDPYLESRWSGVHARLMAYAADELGPQLAEDLTADIEERVPIDRDDDARQARRPDVAVIERPSAEWAAARPVAGGMAVAEPILLLDPGPVTERSIRIIEVAGDRVVTAIEFLSPWNKLTAGGGRDAYLQKRRELLASDTSLVEVDLVRAGDWSVMVPPFLVPRPERTPYRATVSRAHPHGGPLALYPIGLDQRLPTIPIPLRPGEPDVTLDLQGLIAQVYRNGRYGRTDYGRGVRPAADRRGGDVGGPTVAGGGATVIPGRITASSASGGGGVVVGPSIICRRFRRRSVGQSELWTGDNSMNRNATRRSFGRRSGRARAARWGARAAVGVQHPHRHERQGHPQTTCNDHRHVGTTSAGVQLSATTV